MEYLSPQQLAIRWNAPLRAVYGIALGKHSFASLTGTLNIYHHKNRPFFSLEEIMKWERKLARLKIPLELILKEFK
ncbi:MAG: hypothetical protein NUV68_03180 [Caldiserica bacterium]|nr:hypothetical protein [Caldisericota bacterium]MDH7562454.1 hypothetical protein [Caldisericota bacterium]